MRLPLIVGLVLLLLVATGAPVSARESDYAAELARIGQDILTTEQADASPERQLRLGYFTYLKATLTATPEDFRAAQKRLDTAAADPAASVAVYLLRASLRVKLHQLEAASADLDRLPLLADSPQVQVIRADILVQQGQYETAAKIYQALIQRQHKWDYLARLAYLRWKAGDGAGADALYQAAEDELSAKQMRLYAWVELQRGLLDLNRGRPQEAWAHYRHAEQAYSGYWLVQDYMAEWEGAQRRFEAAAERYLKMLQRSPRPELAHALGDLYLSMGQPQRARPWHDQALTAYLESARRGETHYYHHLATLYADSRQEGDEAVRWAEQDLSQRYNAQVLDTHAWALYRAGRYQEALEEIRRALALTWVDVHLLFHAGMIHLAAGETEAGKRFFQQAAAINPHYDAFHVHR